MRECNNCNWIGKVSDCVHLGNIDNLCPECYETTHFTPYPDHNTASNKCWCNPDIKTVEGIDIIIHKEVN